MAERYDFTIDAGATFRRQIRWTAAGSPVNLTGWTGRMQIRQHPDAAVTAAAAVTLGGVAGTIDVLLTATQTTGMSPGRYMYDLELVNGTGDITRLIEGAAIVTAEITKDTP